MAVGGGCGAANGVGRGALVGTGVGVDVGAGVEVGVGFEVGVGVEVGAGVATARGAAVGLVRVVGLACSSPVVHAASTTTAEIIGISSVTPTERAFVVVMASTVAVSASHQKNQEGYHAVRERPPGTTYPLAPICLTVPTRRLISRCGRPDFPGPVGSRAYT